MFRPSLPRALSSAFRPSRLKPAQAAATVGAIVGMAVGAGWLGGAMAKTAVVRAHAERIEQASAAGFTEEALAEAAGGLDPSALAIARRHDPYTVAGGAARDRQAERLTARLEQLRARPAAVGAFRVTGALEESRDLECLTQAAYYEARGEGRDGMRAVTQVVLNRVRNKAFPKSVCGVVFQGAARGRGCQFSFACDGAMRARVNSAAWNRAREIAAAALSGRVHAAVGDATHFHTTAVNPGWSRTMVRVNQVGDHLFYRFGRAGSRATFHYAATPVRAEPVTPAPPPTPTGEVAYTALLAAETGDSPAPVVVETLETAQPAA